jgi:hypothetical protein
MSNNALEVWLENNSLRIGQILKIIQICVFQNTAAQVGVKCNYNYLSA